MSAEDQTDTNQSTSPDAPPDAPTPPEPEALTPEPEHPANVALKLLGELHDLHNRMGSYVLTVVAEKMAELKNHLLASK
jgi:hypothetical protein